MRECRVHGQRLGRHQLGELVVDDQDAVVAYRHRDVAPDAEEHVEAVGELLRLDLGALEVPAEVGQELVEGGLLGERGRGQGQGGGKDRRDGGAAVSHRELLRLQG